MLPKDSNSLRVGAQGMDRKPRSAFTKPPDVEANSLLLNSKTMLLSTRNTLVTLVLVFFAPLEGVTVKPVRCPTNKIAPHRRAAYYEGARTVGAFYDLLAPGGPRPYPQSGLVERPQEDDPDDCGDIEDYDDTDLNSLYQPYRRGHSDNRFFFGGLFGQQPNPVQTSSPPPRPTRPPHDPVHPYWSGGYFGTNYYRPPLQQEPSVHVKPVHDGNFENQSTYRPEIVGGPVNHIVGHYPARPTAKPQESTTQRFYTRYPTRTTESTAAVFNNRRPRPSRPRAYNNDGIVGSFVDLLFKK